MEWLTSEWSEVGGGFAVLFDRWELGPELVEVYRTVLLSDWQDSAAHATGIAATVVRGRVRVGPAGAERELRPGESLRYPGDVPHRFRALGQPAEAVLLVHCPPHLRGRETPGWSMTSGCPSAAGSCSST